MRTYSIAALFALFSAMIVAGESDPPSAPAAGVIGPAANPHWREDGCQMCHKQDQEQFIAIASHEVDLLCLSCHDGVRATREAHPIGRSFAGDQVRRPDSWPVVENHLSCLTCHDVLMHCKPQPRRPVTNGTMLRGPRLEGSQYCGQCHIAELHQQHNPHVMLEQSGEFRPGACDLCHSSAMQSGPTARRTGTPMLTNEEVTLCGQCHKKHIDFFSPGHIGTSPSASVVAHLQRTDVRLGFAVANQLTEKTGLPLRNGRIVCSTCHNPHQAGIFVKESELELGSMTWPKSVHQSASQRLPGRELCSACHGF